MSAPVTEAEHGRLYLSGLCLHAAEFLLRGALSEQWSMAREMVVNDLADRLLEAAAGASPLHRRHTNVAHEEWRTWVDVGRQEAGNNAVYCEALEALDRAVMASFYPTADLRVEAGGLVVDGNGARVADGG